MYWSKSMRQIITFTQQKNKSVHLKITALCKFSRGRSPQLCTDSSSITCTIMKCPKLKKRGVRCSLVHANAIKHLIAWRSDTIGESQQIRYCSPILVLIGKANLGKGAEKGAYQVNELADPDIGTKMSDHQDHQVDQPDGTISSPVVPLDPCKDLLPAFSVPFSLFLALPPATLGLGVSALGLNTSDYVPMAFCNSSNASYISRTVWSKKFIKVSATVCDPGVGFLVASTGYSE